MTLSQQSPQRLAPFLRVSALVIEAEQGRRVLRSEVIGDVLHEMFIHEESSAMRSTI